MVSATWELAPGVSQYELPAGYELPGIQVSWLGSNVLPGMNAPNIVLSGSASLEPGGDPGSLPTVSSLEMQGVARARGTRESGAGWRYRRARPRYFLASGGWPWPSAPIFAMASIMRLLISSGVSFSLLVASIHSWPLGSTTEPVRSPQG